MTKTKTGFLARAILLAAVLAAGLAGPAKAERVCLPFNEMAQQLQVNFAEAPVAMGLADNGALIQIFANGDGSTWTMLLTTPGGVSCLLASGETWMVARKHLAGQPS